MRERTDVAGAIAAGLNLLALVAWRLHRLRRGAELAQQARAAERRSDERLHALVRHSSDVVAIIDGTAHVPWIAGSVRKLLGYEPEELVGRRLGELAHPDDAHRAAGLRRQIAARATRRSFVHGLGRRGGRSAAVGLSDRPGRALEQRRERNDLAVDGVRSGVTRERDATNRA